MRTQTRFFHVLPRLVLVLMTVLHMGCTIVLPEWITISHEDASGGENGNQANLPAPENPQGEPDVLRPEEQSRKDEADVYIANVIYEGRPIEKTVQGKSGTIYDYIRVPEPDILPPDISAFLPSDPLDGLSLGMTEVERYAELWGPAGATVFTRPNYSKYIMDPDGATSIQDWVDNYQIPGIPDDPNRLYAGLNIIQPNVGVFARINAFKPEVEKGTFSVIELLVGCPAEGSTTESVGMLIGVDWANYHVTPTLNVQVERWREINGQRVGGYGTGSGFEQSYVRPTDVGSPLEYFSVVGGEQWEHALLIIMDLEGNWWMFYNHQSIGKYPASLFTTLNKGACRAQVYGEVYNPHPENGWPKTEMGSGRFASGAANEVAWVRQIRYLDTNAPFVYAPNTDDSIFWSKPYHTPCYDRSPQIFQGSDGPLMYLGGPGGKHPVCAQKKPSP